MIFERDVIVTMSDGLQMRANVYRPEKPGRYPVVMLHGPYGKDTHMKDGAAYYKQVWGHMTKALPQLCKSSSCRFIRWEAPDPERWVPDGYVVIHADSRGAGKTPGFMSLFSPRETRDYAELITWASKQPWSNGRVGLLGISYYAMNQWNVAAMQPEGLAAIIPWEGAFDRYRDDGFHGGIERGWSPRVWFERQLMPVQHGNGNSPYRDAITGEPVTGPALSPTMLAGNRESYAEVRARHVLDDAWYAERTADGSRITVPVLSVGNWGNHDVHMRGNFEGYLRAASRNKWLRIKVGDHVEPFYQEESLALQKLFFDRYLKGLDNGWDKQAPLVLAIRHPDKVVERAEREWPLAGTQWTRYYLDAKGMTLSRNRPGASTVGEYQAMRESLTFTSEPFATDAEFTGPVKLKLWVRSSTSDMDIFATLRLLRPDGSDVGYVGPGGQAVPATQGWLRVSHRELDPKESTEYRPYHTHRNPQPIKAGELHEVDVEIRPTSVVVPAGYRLAITIGGKDWYPPSQQGPDRHPGRDMAIYGGTNGVGTGAAHASYLLLPLIPSGRERVAGN
jgi:predicted acyl esterase